MPVEVIGYFVVQCRRRVHWFCASSIILHRLPVADFVILRFVVFDSSEEWKQVSDKEKKDLGLDEGDDGEFW